MFLLQRVYPGLSRWFSGSKQLSHTGLKTYLESHDPIVEGQHRLQNLSSTITYMSTLPYKPYKNSNTIFTLKYILRGRVLLINLVQCLTKSVRYHQIIRRHCSIQIVVKKKVKQSNSFAYRFVSFDYQFSQYAT